MAKRRLTQQQKRRIQKRHSDRQQKPQSGEPANLEHLGPIQKGLVVAHYGKQLEVEALEDDNCGEIFRCHFRATISESLITGDNVLWRPDNQPSNSNSSNNGIGIIESLIPRKTILQRPHAYRQLRPVAANIDRIYIVIAPIPTPYSELIDRYLVAAELSGIQPILLLNKTDLIDSKNRQELQDIITLYRSLDYEVIETSCKDTSSVSTLVSSLNHHVSIFVGQSGVGKSSLVNALIPKVNARVGELSAVLGKGTHTTTNAQLFHLPDGGDLIDSPGIREFGLWHMEREELINGFVELRQLHGQCKFRDCKHEHEPACALRTALENGQISKQRFNNYQRILVSMEDHKIIDS